MKKFLPLLVIMLLVVSLLPIMAAPASAAAPVANAGGPYTVNEGSSIVLSGSGSYDPDGNPVALAWDLDNDGQYDDATGANPSFSAASIDGLASRNIGLQVSESARLFWDFSNLIGSSSVGASNSPALSGVAANTTGVSEGTYLLTRPIHGSSYPYFDFTNTETMLLDSISFYHSHNHNWGYKTYPGYYVRMQIDSGSGYTNIGSPLYLSKSNSGHTSTIDLGGVTVNAGTHRVRWYAYGFHSAWKPDTEFFAVDNVTFNLDGMAKTTSTTTVTVNNVAPVLDSGIVDLYPWKPESIGSASWNVQSGGNSVKQTVNGNATFFYSDFNALGEQLRGNITVGYDGDDDFAGFAIGLEPGDITNPNADYLLIDWKRGDQWTSSWGQAYAGLAVSRVTGVLTDRAAWSHTGTVTQLARGATLGRTGWSYNTTYDFQFEYSPSRLQVFINGALELDVTASSGNPFPDGRFAFYNLSQSQVTYAAVQSDSIGGDEGSTISLSKDFSDAGALDTHTATINWGDGTTSAGTVAEANGSGKVNGSHVYADNGTYKVTVTVTDDDGASGSDTLTATIANVAPALTISGNASEDEASAYTLNLSSSDPGADTITGWTINWGDGVVQTLSGNPSSVNHVYPDGHASYTISSQATDEDGTFNSNSINVSVNNVAPTLTLSGNASVDEGSVYTLNLSSSDPGNDTITSWKINWDDGVQETIAGDPSSVNHTYTDGPASYTISAQATDEDGTFNSSTISVTVNNVTPTVNAGPDCTIDEGDTFTSSSSGPVSWWSAEGNANDSIDGNNGVLLSGTTFAAGQVGQAFSFDGVNDYVQVADAANLDISDAITIAAWINPSALGGRIVDKITAGYGDGYLLDTYQSRLRVIFDGMSISSDQTLGTNVFTHVAATYDGSEMKVYINGVPVKSASGSVFLPPNTLPLRIGADSNGQNVFKGLIDEVVLFNRALSTAEIQALSNATAPWGTFTDPGADTWTATVDYGDGSGVQPLALNGKSFDLDHIYADNGTYPVTVTVQDDDGGLASDTLTVTVDNVAPELTIGGTNSVYYVDWTSANVGGGTASGVINLPDGSTVTVNFEAVYSDGSSGFMYGAQTDGGINYWNPSSPYISTEVPNAPPSPDILQLSGGNNQIYRVTLSEPIVDPIMAIVSLGSGGNTIQYDFDSPFTIVSQDAGYWGGGPDRLVQLTGDILQGNEGHGTIRFLGTFNTFSWTVPYPETWHGFTFGIRATEVLAETVFVDEGETATNGGTWSDPGDDVVTLSASAGTVTKNADGTWDWTMITNDGPAQSQTVTITAADEDGGSTSRSFPLVVNNVAPTADAGADRSAECSIELELGGSLTDPGTADTHTVKWDFGDGNTASGTLTPTHTYSGVDVYTVILTVTDDDGGVGTDTLTVTVVDTTPPEITAASDETVECDGAGNTAELEAWLANNGGAAASDTCGSVTWSHGFNGLSDDCGATGSATVTFTATDDHGNSSITSATFTIEDATPPTLSIPASVTLECSADTSISANGEATASDTCGGVTVTSSDAVTNGCGNTKTITRTWTATDECGNSTSGDQIIKVVDTVNPVITTAASNKTVECDGAGNAEELNAWLDNNGGASASDTCNDITWSNNFGALSDDCGATGSATVIFTATDDCGNFSSTTATFTILDRIAPDITTQASDLTVECDGLGNQAELGAWLESNGGAIASDTCGGVTWSNNFTALSDDCGATGSAMVTFTATDDCGNFSSTTATFTIEDTTPPSIDQFGILEATPYYTTQSIGVNYVVSDICGGTPDVQVVLTNNGVMVRDITGPSPISLSLWDLAGSNNITITVTDACGNVSIDSITFEVILQLIGDGVIIKPESLKVNPGEFTAHVVFPAPYDALTITDATADGAPDQKINLDPPEHKAIIKFDRADVDPDLLDTHFEVTGHFIYNGAGCQFVGYDDIKKVDTEEVPDNNGKGPKQKSAETNR